MPILGILASSITGGLVTDAGAMFPIRSYVVPSGGAASVTFSSIPSTYSHLQIRGIQKHSGTGAWATIELNGDTTAANYTKHRLYGNGTSAGTEASTASKQIFTVYDQWGATIIDILDYSNTNKYKTVRTLSGFDNNGTNGEVNFDSNLWMSTSAINQVTLYLSNFVQYSSFALYGVKA